MYVCVRACVFFFFFFFIFAWIRNSPLLSLFFLFFCFLFSFFFFAFAFAESGTCSRGPCNDSSWTVTITASDAHTRKESGPVARIITRQSCNKALDGQSPLSSGPRHEQVHSRAQWAPITPCARSLVPLCHMDTSSVSGGTKARLMRDDLLHGWERRRVTLFKAGEGGYGEGGGGAVGRNESE